MEAPRGYTAAVRARQLGMRVALVERETLGSVSQLGLYSTKALLKQAELWSQLSRGEEFGFALSDARFDWQKVVARSRDTADGLAQGVAYLMKKNGVEYTPEWAVSRRCAASKCAMAKIPLSTCSRRVRSLLPRAARPVRCPVSK